MLRRLCTAVVWVVMVSSSLELATAQEQASRKTPADTPQQEPKKASPEAGLGPADLEELLGPIALYPDRLLANVLAASVYPLEIVKAARYVQSGGDPEKISAQDWEPSVQAVAMVPELLKMMNEHLDWTEALGQAYLLQGQDVMAAVQALRAKANSSGALQTTPQQVVVHDESTIVIEPAEPNVIYVPIYEPSVVYVEDGGYSGGDVAAAGLIGFGVGVAIGAALNDVDCDWDHHCVCWGWGWHGGAHIDHRDVDINHSNIDANRGNVDINRGESERIADRRPGQEGTAWKPNTDKVKTKDLSGPGATAKLDEFRGVASGNRRASTAIPGDRSAAAGTRAPASGARRDSASASLQDGQGRNAAAPRPAGKNQPAARPAAPQKTPSRDMQRSPSSKPAPRQSGFSPNAGTQQWSQRGAGSRGGGGRQGHHR